mmetsp:Transcript_9588/g.20832  ORF Transcript_9588/g.20832 Transcript_9588/m.20832 type:complete len:427 (-) Transcript_9588:491-1771(-)
MTSASKGSDDSRPDIGRLRTMTRMRISYMASSSFSSRPADPPPIRRSCSSSNACRSCPIWVTKESSTGAPCTNTAPLPPTGDLIRPGDLLGEAVLLLGLRTGESGRLPTTPSFGGERALRGVLLGDADRFARGDTAAPTAPIFWGGVLLGETDRLAERGGDTPPRGVVPREEEYGDLDRGRVAAVGVLRRRRRADAEEATDVPAMLPLPLDVDTFNFLRGRSRSEGIEWWLPPLATLAPLATLLGFLDPFESALPGLPPDDDNASPFPPSPRLLLLLGRFLGPAADRESAAALMDSSSCVDDRPARGDSGATALEGMVDNRFFPPAAPAAAARWPRSEEEPTEPPPAPLAVVPACCPPPRDRGCFFLLDLLVSSWLLSLFRFSSVRTPPRMPLSVEAAALPTVDAVDATELLLLALPPTEPFPRER